VTTLLSDSNVLTTKSDPDRSWSKRWTALGFIVLSAMVLIANFAAIDRNDGQISPVDEWSYIDSVFRGAQGEMVRPGQYLSEEGKEYLACHNVIAVGTLGSGCKVTPQLGGDFPLAAQSPAEIHPPFYFLITAQIAKVVDPLLPSFDLIDSARLVGSLWLLGGFAIWLRVFFLLGIRLPVALAISALSAMSPLVMSVTAFITPDATFAISSGVVVLGTILWLRREINPWWLLAIAAIPVAFKVTHLLTAFSMAALVILLWLFTKSRTARESWAAAGALLAGSAVGLVAWQVARSLLRVSASPVHPEAPPPIALGSFVEALGYHFSKMPLSSTAPIPVHWLSVSVAQIFGWLLIAASVGGYFYYRSRSERWTMSIVSAGSVFFAAAFLSAVTLVLSGGILSPTARYGLPLFLFWAVPLGVVLQTKLHMWAITGLALVSFLAILLP
jgi:hypothetical protein